MAGGTACGKRRRRGTDRRVRPPGNSPDEPSGFLNKGSLRSGSRSLRGSFCFACLPHTGVATSVEIPKSEQDFIAKKLTYTFLPKKEQKFSKPLDKMKKLCYNREVGGFHAGMAQLVEHVIGNDEVIGPNPISSSSKRAVAMATALLLYFFARYGGKSVTFP